MKLKEAVLNGVSLEDASRERFNEIEQVSWLFITYISLSLNKETIGSNSLYYENSGDRKTWSEV